MEFGRAELLDSIRALAQIGAGGEDPSDIALSFEFILLEVARGRYACLTAAEHQAVDRLNATLRPLGIESERPELWNQQAVVAAPEWGVLRAVAADAVEVFEAR